jgi:hypothetical protein
MNFFNWRNLTENPTYNINDENFETLIFSNFNIALKQLEFIINEFFG